jgi:TATA-binding protein-associated factor Taf7
LNSCEEAGHSRNEEILRGDCFENEENGFDDDDDDDDEEEEEEEDEEEEEENEKADCDVCIVSTSSHSHMDMDSITLQPVDASNKQDNLMMLPTFEEDENNRFDDWRMSPDM